MFALGLQFFEQHPDFFGYFLELCAGEQFQVHQYLVVARPSAMDFLPHVAQFTGEQQFHLRVHVFHTLFDGEAPGFDVGMDAAQFLQQHRQFVLAEQSDGFQHGDVRHRTQYVVPRQIQIKFTVAADRELFYFLIDFRIFFPKFACHIVFV